MIAVLLKLSHLLFVTNAARLRIKTYRVTVNVQERYVRTEVAVHVKNNLNTDELYEFGVLLEDREFISSLTMRIGANECKFSHLQSEIFEIILN
jgi:hypothetical protein